MSGTWGKVVGLRYLEKFQCIGPACEETCCAGWGVGVDTKHFHKLERLVPAEELAAKTRRADKGAGVMAYMVLDGARRCAFLEEDKLCSLQRRFGEEALPNTCATYPRSFRAIGKRLEAYATLSCPEVTRLAFSSPEAVEITDLDGDRVGRISNYRTLHDETNRPWIALLDVLRRAMYRTLQKRSLSLPARWFALTAFAHQSRGYLHQNVEQLAEDEINFELSCLENDEITTDLAIRMHKLPPYHELAGTAVARTLEAFREADKIGTVSRLAAELFGPDYSFDPERVIRDDLARRPEMPADLRARAMALFTNASINMTLREWYLDSPTLVHYFHGQLLRLCLMRLFLWAHPGVRAAAALDGEARLEAFDRAAVEVTYRVAREFEHQRELWGRLQEALMKFGFDTPAHSTSFVLWLDG
jgi:lysine-N-methylase